MRFVVDTGTDFLRIFHFFPVSIIPPMLRSHLRLHVAVTRRTRVEAWSLLKHTALSEIRSLEREENVSLGFKGLNS